MVSGCFLGFCVSLTCSVLVGVGYEEKLYEELWRGCAGPLVDVPRRGERVFYFPQGHMEQVKIRNSQIVLLLGISQWNWTFYDFFSVFLVRGDYKSGIRSADPSV